MARKLYAIAKLNEISNDLDNRKRRALQLIMEKGKEELKKYVQVYWYDTYTPTFYDRTDEFLNCVNAEFVGDNEVKIFYDEGKLSASFGNPDGWNQHMGFDGSPFVGSSFLEKVEFGMGGGSPSNPRIGASGVHGMQRIRAWLLTYVKKALAQAFR